MYALMNFLCFDSNSSVRLSFLFFPFLVKNKITLFCLSLTFLNASLLLLLFNGTNKMSSNGKFSYGCYLNDYHY